jgi:aminopeptidase N
MRRFPRFSALALATGMGASPAAAIDPFFPTFGNNGINVIHYDLDLEVAPGPGTLDGSAELFIIAQRRLEEFSLDLAGLDVSRVTVNEVPADFEQANDKLILMPREPIGRGSVFKLSVAYAGRPDPIPDPTAPGSDLELGWFTYGDASYVVSEPVGASTFYPANDEPTDKATFSIAVTVPADYTATANGVLRSVRTSGSEKRFRWEMRQPMTTWLATVHVNQFRLQLTRAADGTPIRVYYTDATPPADVDSYALSGEILTWMEELVGPYPFGSYGSVVVDDPLLYYALETQAMSTFPLGTADEATVAHEVAHQWFGDSSSIAKWEDLWIAEGAATYFEVLWPNRDDPASFDAEMLTIYDYVAATGVGPAVVESPEEMFTDRTYLRGASALYALREEVGDRTFFRILRIFVTAYRGRNATSRNFIKLAVFVSGRLSVAPLLHAWLYDEPVPALAGHAAATALQEEGPALPPDVVGLRCGRGAHRGAPATCD